MSTEQFEDTLVGRELAKLCIEQLSQKPQTSERRSSTICAVVERPDHHCGDDLVYVFVLKLCPAFSLLGLEVFVLRSTQFSTVSWRSCL